MRSPRASIAGLGTSGSLPAAVVCVLVLATLFAFGWSGGPGVGGGGDSVRVGHRGGRALLRSVAAVR